MDIEPDLIVFGAPGVDDWAFAPDVILRLDDSEGYLLLEDSDQDDDPTDADASWPVVPGDQVIWIEGEDDAEPLAIVSADRAGDQATLEAVAEEFARGSDDVRVEVTPSGDVQVFYEPSDE